LTRSVRIVLGDILHAAELVDRYAAGLTREQFAADSEKQDAVARRLEIIGEAVKRLPEDLKERHPDVPWREIAGIRDVIVHEYFRIDVELAWQMVKKDVPQLAARVRAILAALEG
jgi:uncharacterized protein with HEPN domain